MDAQDAGKLDEDTKTELIGINNYQRTEQIKIIDGSVLFISEKDELYEQVKQAAQMGQSIIEKAYTKVAASQSHTVASPQSSPSSNLISSKYHNRM
jgi:hypothetical protein